MRQSFRTITSVLATLFTGLATCAMIGAPAAVAQSCEPGQSEIAAGECIYPDNKTHEVPGGKVQCTQHSCVYRQDS